MRRVAHGAPATRLGLPPFEGSTQAHVEAAVTTVFGWEGDGPRARIAPDAHGRRLHRGVRTRSSKWRDDGGRIAFATTRPGVVASALPPSGRARWRRGRRSAARRRDRGVRSRRAAGCAGSTGSRCSPTAPRSSATTASTPRSEWLFTLARPELVVCDRTYAGVAVGAGLEVVAFADLDAVALAVAAWQGRAVRIVPLDERRPPRAYTGLLDLLETLAAGPGDPIDPFRTPDADRLVAALLQHGPQGPTLAPRRSGGNGRGEPVAQSFATARFLTVQEVADLMRVSTMTVYRIIKSGELPAVRVGRSFRVRDVDVDTYLGYRYTQAG